MVDFNKIYSNTEKRIDKLLFNSKSMIRTSVRKLEEDIVSRSAAILDIGKAGNIKAQKELSQAIKFHGELAKEFQSRYGTTVQSSSKSFLEVQSIIRNEFKGLDLPYSFGAADKDMFEALRRSAAGGLQHLGEDTMGKIAQATYSAVITGQSFGSFVKNIKAQMGSLEKYAQTRAHDSLMDYYTDLNIKKSGDAGIETFLYYGNIVRASRPFCIARVGMVFTIKQIQEWDKLSWAGKRPGPTLINRGGYNCRHSLHPCEPEWIEDGKVKVQSWLDQKEKMDPKLVERVKAEEAKLKIKRPKPKVAPIPKAKEPTKLETIGEQIFKTEKESSLFDEYYQKYMAKTHDIDYEFMYKELKNMPDLMAIFDDWKEGSGGRAGTSLKVLATKLERKKVSTFCRKVFKDVELENYLTDEMKDQYVRARALQQARFDRQGVSKITLHRGTEGVIGEKYKYKVMDLSEEAGDAWKKVPVKITDDAISGYTRNEDLAHSFGRDSEDGGITVKRKIKTKDIFFEIDNVLNMQKGKTVYGYEKEVLTLGGEIEIQLKDVSWWE